MVQKSVSAGNADLLYLNFMLNRPSFFWRTKSFHPSPLSRTTRHHRAIRSQKQLQMSQDLVEPPILPPPAGKTPLKKKATSTAFSSPVSPRLRKSLLELYSAAETTIRIPIAAIEPLVRRISNLTVGRDCVPFLRDINCSNPLICSHLCVD